MKRRLLYPYHFNFGTSRTQEQNHALLLQYGRERTAYHQIQHYTATGAETTPYYFNMEELHNISP